MRYRAVIVRTAVLMTLPVLAERMAVVALRTVLVVTWNETLVEPAGTVTNAGTRAWVMLLERATTVPPLGAGPLSVTVKVAVVPPRTLVVGLVRVATVTGAAGKDGVLWIRMLNPTGGTISCKVSNVTSPRDAAFSTTKPSVTFTQNPADTNELARVGPAALPEFVPSGSVHCTE